MEVSEMIFLMWTDEWKPSIIFYAHAFYVFTCAQLIDVFMVKKRLYLSMPEHVLEVNLG